MITGGSGSLGKAIIAEQDLLLTHGISRIRVLSRDEQKQMSLMRSYKGQIPVDCYLADVSDAPRMHFGLKDAHFVIHTAAQKHIEKFELDVPTGYKTNIQGSQNVADAFMASKNAVSGIFVSTDKAASPTTPYGVSKLAAEYAWLWHNTFQKNIRFGVARYGNVFGSKGSVIETWTDSASRNTPLRLTDPRCSRFFIEIEEAAQFVIRSLFRNECRLHIPQMKSSSMEDIAHVIWEHFNPREPLLVEKIGMRSVEKIHEILEVGGISSEEAERFTEDELKGMYDRWLRKLGSS